MGWFDVASIMFGRKPSTGASEQIDKTEDGRNALKVENQHSQPLTSAELTSAGLATQTTLASVLAKLDVALSTRAGEATLATRASETTLADVNAKLATALIKLGDIFGAVDGLELTAGNIELNGADVALNTDEVEAILRTIRDNLGLITDVAAAGDGTLISIVKRLRTLLAGGLPAALADGRLKTDAHLLARYRIADEAAGATAYYGFLANNGDWYVMREVAATGEYRYANPSNNGTITGGYSGAGADKAWVNRATLTYSYFNVLTGL